MTNLNNIFNLSKILVLAKIFKVKCPLTIRCALTYKCNKKCIYCGIPEGDNFEIDASKICKMITEFADLGTKWISFSGGEPLLKEGVDSIIQHAKSKNKKTNNL